MKKSTSTTHPGLLGWYAYHRAVFSLAFLLPICIFTIYTICVSSGSREAHTPKWLAARAHTRGACRSSPIDASSHAEPHALNGGRDASHVHHTQWDITPHSSEWETDTQSTDMGYRQPGTIPPHTEGAGAQAMAIRRQTMRHAAL